MAIVKRWNGAGLSAGALTTSTAGTGDDPFDALVGTGQSVVNTGDHAPQIQFAQAAATACAVYWNLATVQTAGDGRVTLTTPATLPASSWQVLKVNTGGTTAVFSIAVASTGAVRLLDSTNAVLDATPSASPLATSTRYRFEWQVTHSTGVINAQVFTGDQTTALYTLTGTVTGMTASHDRVIFGMTSTTPTVPTIALDELAVGNTAAALGPVTPAAADSVLRRWSGDSGTDTAFSSQAANITSDATGFRPPRLKFTWTSGTIMLATWGGLGSLAAHAGRIGRFELGEAPTATWELVSGQDAANARTFVINVTAASRLRLRQADNTQVGTDFTTTMELGRVYRIEWIQPSSTSLTVRLFAGDSATVLETQTVTGTFGALNNFRLGNPSASTIVSPIFYADEIAISSTATFIGPAVSTADPVANAGADQSGRASFATVTLTGSGAGTGGQYRWAQTSGTAVTLSSTTAASPTFTVPASLTAGNYTFEVTAINAAGAAAVDQVVVSALAHRRWLKTATGIAAVRRG